MDKGDCKNFNKMSEVLFTTYDCYDITEGMKYYTMKIKKPQGDPVFTKAAPLYAIVGPYINPKATEPTGELLYFYKKENAEKYFDEVIGEKYGPFEPISEWEKDCIMTIEDLEMSVECGAITGWDGWGAFAVKRKHGEYLRGKTFDPEDLDFDVIRDEIDLVLWFNK